MYTSLQPSVFAMFFIIYICLSYFMADNLKHCQDINTYTHTNSQVTGCGLDGTSTIVE